MIEVTAFAKANLGLRVGAVGPDGYHRLWGIFQSIDLSDRLTLATAAEDSITTVRGGEVPDGWDNLAWRAVAAVRRHAGATRHLAVTLDKHIPVAAGLGGGSADAAAALAAAGRLLGVDRDTLAFLAPQLGSDVPFCLTGGTARVSGRGEIVAPLDELSGFALAVVVPPVELSTAAVFRRWDELDGPAGHELSGRDLPPSLRFEAPLRNDLYPAATSLAPVIDDWRATLAASWGRPVVMSGSGPSLYGFFVDPDEAAGALNDLPPGARAAAACDLAPAGWRIVS
jgi:4-diphosphocytidyl-2-C-methyl-D-erythritol kinase